MLAIEIVLWYNGWAEQRKRNRIEYRDTLYLLKIKPIMSRKGRLLKNPYTKT